MSKGVWKHSPSGRTVRRKKSKSPPFVQIPKYMITSAAWRSLSGSAMAAYLELFRRYNGTNNGQLHLSVREFAELYGRSQDTAAKALRELVDKGFIEIVRLSGFNLKDRRRQATEYRLSLHVCDVTRKLPSKAFMHWRPEAPETPQREAAE
jgi:Helix-turn-helix domain